MNFAHLHVHSHYSLLDGANRIPDLIDTALKHNMTSLALTDHGNMFGAMEFYRKAKDAGLKPIPGIEAYISPTDRTDRSMGRIDTAAYHILLLAINNVGWSNLLKLSSRAYLEGFYYRPRVDRELLSELNEGLVCCTACLGGEVPSALLAGDEKKAVRLASEYRDIFGKDRFFIEMQNTGYKEQEQINPGLAKLAKELDIGLVGTNDVHFLNRDDKSSHEVLTCIATGKVLTPEEKDRYSAELYLKSPEEMSDALSEWPEAITNTLKIAEMCECEPDYSEKQLPVFETPEGQTPAEYLRDLGNEGLRERFGGKMPPEEYQKRLDWELKVIKDKEYCSYFLIINDCVQFARQNEIPASPRGSGVATLLGYALDITNIDPVKYGLLFERFTDPQREEDPDIDLDICQNGRAKVIQYVREKYGHVAQIITYGSLKARAAIRDVGRVMDIPLSQVDVIAKLVPEGPGVTLKSALQMQRELRDMYDTDPQVKELIDHALKLEGLARHSGIHAAGVVVCDKPLETFLPLCKQADSNESITQWDGQTCMEDVGLMKMDFLGLRTLTIIQRTRELVKERTGKDVDPEALPLDDTRVLELFCEGRTDGVFQFESEGMKAVLRQMKPNRIDDLIAANAMYRPGPMKLIPAYCMRKHGKEEIPKNNEMLDNIVAETYGIMAYQEQVMQVLNRLGKIPLNTAYTLIKAISKKKEKTISAEQANFVRGAGENGIDEREANRLFALIREFGGYGFNKAHSTRYAIVAYQTAYFKVYHPTEFLAATLTFESINRDKVVQYMAEAVRMGITIAPPDINTCSSDFAVDGDKVRFGLAAVKGVGAKAIDAIVATRKEVGSFKDLFHFCKHVDSRVVNRSTVETLIRCGAFDSVGDSHRAAMIAALDTAIKASQVHATDRRRGQISLFEAGDDEDTIITPIPDTEPWGRDEMLAAERETLGFYVSSHPLTAYGPIVDNLNWPRRLSLSSVPSCPADTRIACGCMIDQVRTILCKRGRSAGKKMAILTLEDLSGKCEAVVFPDSLEKMENMITVDTVVYVTAVVSRRQERLSVAIDSIRPLEAAMPSATSGIILRFPGYGADEDLMKKVGETLKANRGDCRVVLHVRPDEQSRSSVVIEPSSQWFVRPSRKLIDELSELVGVQNIILQPKEPPRYEDKRKKWRNNKPALAR